MGKRSRPDGPCRTKATYDHKRPAYDPPSPDRVAAAQSLKAIECAKDRAFDKLLPAEKTAKLVEVVLAGVRR